MSKRRPSEIEPFYGEYTALVDSEGRICLRAEVIRQLRNHNVGRLWVAKVPDEQALILCPEDNWPRWVEEQKKRFPCLNSLNGTRAFLAGRTPVKWDRKGRVSISYALRERGGMKPETRAVIVGLEAWFEVWPADAFCHMAQRVEKALEAVGTQREESGGQNA